MFLQQTDSEIRAMMFGDAIFMTLAPAPLKYIGQSAISRLSRSRKTITISLLVPTNRLVECSPCARL